MVPVELITILVTVETGMVPVALADKAKGGAK